MMTDDRRLIEDYLPIQAISAEASREKSVRKGHISTLHLWWARRPLVACRAAVYGALVPASQFVPNGGSDAQKTSLGRANASKFIERLCQYPGAPDVIKEAERHILKAHAERLTRETGKSVTVDDILARRAPRPKVLDMFAGGGAIPLEALRLGCEAYALDLNPVAHIIQLCTLVYPQKFGKSDPSAKGCGEGGTWAGLAAEVEHWGKWVLEKVKAEIRDLYPPIPDPEASGDELGADPQATMDFAHDPQQRLKVKRGFLTPVAYLWTRTVRCKNPACGATVPLVKQTWLCKKKDRNVAIRVVAPTGGKRVRFEIVEARTEADLGFDPEAFSKGGNATCPFCGTVADSDYVKEEGCAGRMGAEMMGLAAAHASRDGKTYLAPSSVPSSVPDDASIRRRIGEVCARSGITVPDEEIVDDAKNSFWVRLYGITRYGQLFTPRQLLSLLTLASAIRDTSGEMERAGLDAEHRKAIATLLACALDKQADFNSSLCTLKPQGGRGILHTFVRQGLPMAWDFAEANPLCEEVACWRSSLNEVVTNLSALALDVQGKVQRGSATAAPFPTASFDAVVTDPPYYDNVSYADLSDFFFVWLKRSVGYLYPEHFATAGTPKKQEAVADATRHGRDKAKASEVYERMMSEAFSEAYRMLKPGAPTVCVYAHKTTLGWATLVDSLRKTGFCVTEAWPLDTETTGRLLAHSSAALASSIFLVACKRDGAKTGSYEDEVRPELEQIVRERVETLWRMGITGADLIIAAVGAGLRAFTRFARVEYANGEEVPAERFLGEVESVVLETLLEKIFGVAHSSVSAVDGPSRFYVLWRFAYRTAELDAGEAIVFTYGQPVELDGADGLASGALALVEKKKGKYRLRDFTERGSSERLGQKNDEGKTASLIDVLHRALWLVENQPRALANFLVEADANRDQLRLVAQALAGAGLSGGSEEQTTLVNTTAGEHAALGKLLANWRALVPETLFTK
jgi:putative DNA methylase